jgi:cell division protein FtsI (penicillin-binding protein 3)
MSHARTAKLGGRLFLFVLLLVALVAALGVRLVDFQVVRADEIQEISLAKRAVTNTIPALRGEIVDSNGVVLARTVRRYDINADPKIVGPVLRVENGVRTERSVFEIATSLAEILEMEVDEIMTRLEGDSRYSSLKRGVTADVYNEIRALQVPWVYHDSYADRLYPNGSVAGNLLGFLSRDGEPLEGLERQFNSCLAGIDGQETFERSVDFVPIPSSTVTTQPTQDGGRLHLTIDTNLQFFAQQVLADVVADLGADWATAIVVEVDTGRLLVAAEAPTVDPNDPTLVPAADRGARVFRTAIEPGSTMKTMSVAFALDTGHVNPFESITVPDTMKTPHGEWIKDSFSHAPLDLTITGVLRTSSNVGLSKFAVDIPKKVRHDYLQKFGFGQVSDLMFPGESSGILHPPNRWDAHTNYTTLFGQGISVTTLQMAYAYQALANGGVRLSPQLVAGCETPEGELLNATVPQQRTRVVSEATARLTVDMLEKVVETGGVGRLAQIAGYRVGGKTGTAQISQAGGYGDRFAVSFFGLAPAEKPKYVVGVTIYRPVGVTNSAPSLAPFKAIMEQALKHYRVPPSTGSSRDLPQTGG